MSGTINLYLILSNLNLRLMLYSVIEKLLSMFGTYWIGESNFSSRFLWNLNTDDLFLDENLRYKKNP